MLLVDSYCSSPASRRTRKAVTRAHLQLVVPQRNCFRLDIFLRRYGEYEGDLVPPRYADYRDTVVAMVEDVVRIKFQGKPPKKKSDATQ